jgi:MFS family permease
MSALLSVFVLLLLPNMASPIYPLWQDQMGFSPSVISLLFAVYPMGVLLSLFGVMRYLKRFGWRASLLAATAAAFVGSLLLVAADGPLLLAVSRFITGVSTGICLSVGASTMTAVLERWGVRNAARGAAIVLSSGFACGPLIAGLVADHAPRPTVLVFALEAVALAAVAVWLAVDPALRSIDDHHRSGVVAAGPTTVRMLPVEVRPTALLTATWVFVACGIACATYQSIGSSYLKDLMGEDSATFAGLLVFLVFGSAFLGQLLMSDAGTRAQAWVALGAGVTGSVLCLAGVLSDSVAALFVAASLAGASQGLGQSVGITVARQTTGLDRLPGVLSRLNVLAYGLAGGSILVSAPLIDLAGVDVAIGVLAASVVTLSAGAITILCRSHRSFVLRPEPAVALT